MDPELMASLFSCRECGSDYTLDDGKNCLCRGCGSKRKLDGNIYVDPGINDDRKENSDDYKLYYHDTKLRYQSDRYSLLYRDRYKKRNLKNIYNSYIADKERAGVDKLLKEIKTGLDLVIDLPAGTGKLAPVHAAYDYSVLAADVSCAMLKNGDEEWNIPGFIGFVQSDITDTGFKDNSFDCFICLRLMHRLPMKIVVKALREMQRVTRGYMIISNGLNLASLAGLVGRKKPAHGEPVPGRKQWRDLLSEYGEVVREVSIMPLVSKEVISLVRLNK